MAHVARVFHAPCVKYLRPFNVSMMYTGIDCEYNSHFLTTFHFTLTYPLIDLSTARPPVLVFMIYASLA